MAPGVCDVAETKSKGGNVRLDPDVLVLLRRAAAFSDENMGSIASGILRPALKARLSAAMEKELAAEKKEDKRKKEKSQE